jgi:hypothetical protein
MAIQQTLIRALGDEPVPPPPILGLVLTSGLYPVLVDEDVVALGASLMSAGLFQFFGLDEQLNMGAALPAATLTETITYNNYTNWPVEEVNLAAAPLVGATLTTTIAFISYANWPIEEVNLAASLVPGSLSLVVTIQYIVFSTWPVESVDLSASLQGATLA